MRLESVGDSTIFRVENCVFWHCLSLRLISGFLGGQRTLVPHAHRQSLRAQARITIITQRHHFDDDVANNVLCFQREIANFMQFMEHEAVWHSICKTPFPARRQSTVEQFSLRSYIMKRWILALVTVVAVSSVGAASASAQGYGSPYGSAHSNYGYNNYARQPGYSSGYGSRWHDTSHYDYHPGSIQRHRLHFHYVPGHYDFHRSGHGH